MEKKILSVCEKVGYAFGYTLGFLFVVIKRLFVV